MLFGGLVRQIRKWDTASKIGLLMAVVLISIEVLAWIALPEIRPYAMISIAATVIAAQAIILWGNRNMVLPYTRAQRHFIAGQFTEVCDILKVYTEERNRKGKVPHVDSLVLLGNAYRNLGQLRESESVLRIALAHSPNYHFALYGLGKVRLAMGDYLNAKKHFSDAIKYGAPPITGFDLALTQYLLREDEACANLLVDLPRPTDVHRQLMITHILHVLKAQPPPDESLIEAGTPFWIAESERCGDTPYGVDLKAIIARFKILV